MRCGMTLYIQNYDDWNRCEAIERGESAPPLDPQADVKRFTEEIDTASKIEDQCIPKLQQIAKDFHPEEFMLVMRLGSMPKDVADKSVALFAKEVLPAIHEIKLEDPITYSDKRPELVYG